ncbi:MAG: hypothetical protein VZR73_08135 [Acutalibacteraceae bacterium]|nr:hypothetical protein [Acutalibacteraceae bacterium]
MQIKYAAISCAMSLTVIMLLSPLISRKGDNRRVFSTGTGIIIYRIVKSIFVECGWGFAAASGVLAGLFFETAAMGMGMLMCKELRKAPAVHGDNIYLSGTGIIMILAGNKLLYDYSVSHDIVTRMIGESGSLALLACAVYNAGKKDDERSASGLVGFGAICSTASAAAFVLLNQILCLSQNSFAVPLLIMIGVCAMIPNCVDFSQSGEKMSPTYFAGGLMLAYGLDCMCV